MVSLAPFPPMLATLGQVPRGPRWAFEWKWDGVRALVAVHEGRVRAWSRNLREITRTYPELAGLAEVVNQDVLLDGELVTLDARGRPDFGRLQSRMHVRKPTTRILTEFPVAFYVFDLLRLGRDTLTEHAYAHRRAELTALQLTAPPWLRTPDYYTDVDGDELLRIAREHGLEGVVAKRVDSRYQPGKRSRYWIKTPLRLTQEVVLGGWIPGEGRRAGTLGALLLGVYDEAGQLHYAGHVGTGFTEAALRDMQTRLERIARHSSPFAGRVPREFTRRAHWVETRAGRGSRAPAVDRRRATAPPVLAGLAIRSGTGRGAPGRNGNDGSRRQRLRRNQPRRCLGRIPPSSPAVITP